MNTIRMLLTIGIAFSAGVLSLPALLMWRGVKASPPSHMETVVVNGLKHKILVGNKWQKNPLRTASDSLAEGQEAFSHYCVACHGMDGRNTGVPFADKLAPSAPSLASQEVQGYTDGQLKWIIDNGIWPSGMPGSRDILSDEEIWSIVVYLRHLPPPGSVGEPEMYTH